MPETLSHVETDTIDAIRKLMVDGNSQAWRNSEEVC